MENLANFEESNWNVFLGLNDMSLIFFVLFTKRQKKI